MSAIALPAMSFGAFPANGLVERVRAAEPRFFATAMLMLLAMVPTGFAALVDNRELLGVDIWLKPLKFEFALLVYLSTLAFFALFLPETTKAKRWYRVFTSAISIGAVVEIVWLAGASAIGTTSHFNPTPFGQVIYASMGMTAVLITSASAVFAFHIGRNASTGLSPAVKEALVLGLALTLPLTLLTAGTMSQMGTHFIGGTPSDAGGFPVMGWSRDGGDLRAAHFFSTHALHFVPVLGILSAAIFGWKNRLPARVIAVAFAAFVVFLFGQALSGLPLLPSLG
jgi:hypothetical protein